LRRTERVIAWLTLPVSEGMRTWLYERLREERDMAKAGVNAKSESEYGGVGGMLTPASKGKPMRPEWEEMVMIYETDPADPASEPTRPA
jgi:hypothetical protein